MPTGIVHGAVGHEVLGTVTDPTTLSGGTLATGTVNVIAGSDAASNDAVTTFANHFAVCFSGCVGSSVVFSGSQFYLYLSKDGLAQISSGDVKYAGLFNVAALASTTVTMSKQTNGTFYLGTVGGDELISGPLPVKISADYKYIKMFDGSIVAVSAQTVSINPGLTATPTSGPAGTQVTVSGGGFPSAAKIALNYTFSYTSWSGTTHTKHYTWVSSGITNNAGWFTKTTAIADLKQVYNPYGDTGIIPSTQIMLSAVNASKLSQALTPMAGNVNFSETNRVFNQVVSYESGHIASFTTRGTYGNDTNGVGTTLPTIEVYYNGTIGIVGNYTLVGSTVTVTVGSTTLGSVTSNPTTGYYVINVTVPALAVGLHLVSVTNNGVVYQFYIFMNPTLFLKPYAGPVYQTVTVTAYGFPTAGGGFHGKVSLYWYSKVYGDGTNFFLLNATIGSNGEFNVTNVHFTVPKTFGGDHMVTATETYLGKTTGYIYSSYPYYITESDFNVLPTLTVSPTTLNSNVEGFIVATGTGFCPSDNCEYIINVDHSISGQQWIAGGNNGDLQVNFTSAGFTPGIHQIEIVCYSWDYNCFSNNYYGNVSQPSAFAYFNVTATGSTIGGGGGLPASVINTINAINTNVNTILGWQSIITGMSTKVDTINTNVATINTNVATILGWESTILNINSTVNGLKATLAAMQTALGTISTDLGTTSLASVLTQATTAANSANTAATAANDAKSSVSSTETYVLVVAVLAAITLVLELAILVRKLD